MRYISAITSEPRQRFSFPVEGYDSAIFTLEFKPNQNAWFFNLEWQTFAVYNQQLTTHNNVLRQYSKLIPFGIAVWSAALQDPMTDDAFLTDCKLYFLTAADVIDMETTLYGS